MCPASSSREDCGVGIYDCDGATYNNCVYGTTLHQKGCRWITTATKQPHYTRGNYGEATTKQLIADPHRCVALEKMVEDQEKDVAATEAAVDVVVKAESAQTAVLAQTVDAAKKEADAGKKEADADSPANKSNLVSGAAVMVAAAVTALVF